MHEGIITNLITQFGEALDCMRELVQNSIDAGTHQVDIWMDFTPGEDFTGVIEIHVDDWGEGMNEEIIDNQFTRLFASTKDDDLTKIGKFGIGFISVFALRPKGVLVQTGRAGGEHWEVFFDEQLEFSKGRLDHPVEGTQITIFLEGTRVEYEQYYDGIKAALTKWCAHALVPITLEDRFQNLAVEEITQPFALQDVDCKVRFEEPDTEIVIGYSHRPEYGFYNRGLTLMHTTIGVDAFREGVAHRLQHISVKIMSRWLEHTLSRDNVLRDQNYHRAIDMILKLADTSLIEKLVADLEELVLLDSWGLPEIGRYARLISYYALENEERFHRYRERKVFRSVHGKGYSAQDLYQAYQQDGRILVSDTPSDLTRRIEEMGHPVVLGLNRAGSKGAFFEQENPLFAVHTLILRAVAMVRRTTLIGAFFQAIDRPVEPKLRRAIASPEEVFVPVVADAGVSEEDQPLIKDLERVLRSAGVRFKRISTVTATAELPLFVVGRKIETMMLRPPEGDAVELGRRMEVGVNRSHEHYKKLSAFYKQDPHLAAYMLARCLLLTFDTDLHLDTRLMQAALA